MISLATWVLWVHILSAALWLGGAATVLVAILPAPEMARADAARRSQFLTSRAMEVLILTGLLNILLKGWAGSFALSAGFFGMLSLKTAIVAVMAFLQFWMSAAWTRAGAGDGHALRRARVGLSTQCVLGAVAALLGLGLRVA